MKIGFLNNQIDNRGTGNAVFDYARYNEEILGNISRLYTFRDGAHDKAALIKYAERFHEVRFIEDGYKDVDVLYHIKSGENDARAIDIPYLVHSVFANDPHGTRYAVVSKWAGEKTSLPYVPHIVASPKNVHSNLRDRLDIPASAVVFGRHGGLDTFDIPWVWNAVNDAMIEKDDVFLILMNTAVPNSTIIAHPERVKLIDPTVIPLYKEMFINTCDAMLHARARGETFGIAVAEFAIRAKPVLTYALSGEQAHLQELGGYSLLYHDEDSLYEQLIGFNKSVVVPPLYAEFTPQNVMAKFKEVFLDGLDTRGKS